MYMNVHYPPLRGAREKGRGEGEGRERIKEGWRAGERNSNRKREKMERVR